MGIIKDLNDGSRKDNESNDKPKECFPILIFVEDLLLPLLHYVLRGVSLAELGLGKDEAYHHKNAQSYNVNKLLYLLRFLKIQRKYELEKLMEIFLLFV